MLHKAVVVQSGARDAYQVALALQQSGLLERLVTDLYWPTDQGWANQVLKALPSSLQTMLRQRSSPHLNSSLVKLCAGTGLLTMLMDKVPGTPFAWRQRMTRMADASLGRTAGQLAQNRGAGLLSYSYYGYDAFSHYPGPGMLFQLHPHPASMRRILSTELAEHPDCAESLQKEWELCLPEEDFQHLVAETRMASRFLVASSFTRETLIENGASPEAITVHPYGVDCTRFFPGVTSTGSRHPEKLRLLFVGRINQRKGIKYLLEALRLLGNRNVHLTVCGRVVDGLELFRPFADQVEVRPSVSEEELRAAYQAADLFVFPSVAEGFGQVLLESLASGLPILSTTRTAAPDLIEDGREGFIVAPRRPDLLAERIDWAFYHRTELREMRTAARLRAETFTWKRFRRSVGVAVGSYLGQESRVHEEAGQYV